MNQLVKFNLVLAVTSLENANLFLYKSRKRTTGINTLIHSISSALDKGEWPVSCTAYMKLLLLLLLLLLFSPRKNPSGLRI